MWPALFSAVDITANPRDSAVSFITPGAEPDWWSIPQLAPWVIRSLWLNPSCGSAAVNGFDGS